MVLLLFLVTYVMFFQEVEEGVGSVSNVRRKVTWPGTVLMLPHRVSFTYNIHVLYFVFIADK